MVHCLQSTRAAAGAHIPSSPPGKVAIKVVCYCAVVAVAALGGIACVGLLRREGASARAEPPRPDPVIDRHSAAPSASELVQCLFHHTYEASHGTEPRWLAVYGDSLARGMFFDTVERLNGTSPLGMRGTNELDGGRDSVHPGHSANYSQDCTLTERRPPLRRSKCGAFTFDSDPSSPGRLRPVLLMEPNDASPGAATVGVAAEVPSTAARWPQTAAPLVRLSFRLKTFTWEPEFDVPWLRALRHAARMPDVLLLSFGIWDMQVRPMAVRPRALHSLPTVQRRHASARPLMQPPQTDISLLVMLTLSLPAPTRAPMHLHPHRRAHRLPLAVPAG